MVRSTMHQAELLRESYILNPVVLCQSNRRSGEDGEGCDREGKREAVDAGLDRAGVLGALKVYLVKCKVNTKYL